MRRLSKKSKLILKVIVILFAIWGFLLTSVYFAMKLGLTKKASLVDSQSEYFTDLWKQNKHAQASIPEAVENFKQVQILPEWDIVKAGIIKDRATIEKVSKLTGINSRLLITPLIVEQLRLMTSQREIFKQYFQPLAVLGSQTQFSLGIYGIKEATAKQIEANLKNKNSVYYLGSKYVDLLDYGNSGQSLLVYSDTLEPVKDRIVSTTSTSTQYRGTILLTGSDAERIKRLTDEQDHYYSYLYAALYLKELQSAWTKAGFSIENRPAILATLFNIGFENSRPKASPQIGGAMIDLGSAKYTFGSLAFNFYFSDELTVFFGR